MFFISIIISPLFSWCFVFCEFLNYYNLSFGIKTHWIHGHHNKKISWKKKKRRTTKIFTPFNLHWIFQFYLELSIWPNQKMFGRLYKLHIKILRIDRGVEFTSNEFAYFCIKNGIQRQLNIVYTPQQNGIVERKNHTIMEMIWSMI